MKKYAEDLANEYEFNTAEEFFNYIVDSLINGQRKQARELFLKMKPSSQEEFLNDFLQEDGGYHSSCRKICISALLS